VRLTRSRLSAAEECGAARHPGSPEARRRAHCNTRTHEEIGHHPIFGFLGTTVFTLAHEDSGNTYTADGVFLFRGTFHLVEHFTVTDGVIRVDFVRFHLHFFGEC
jgi:hypothetical protein